MYLTLFYYCKFVLSFTTLPPAVPNVLGVLRGHTLGTVLLCVNFRGLALAHQTHFYNVCSS